MTNPFDPCWLRIDRAETHRQAAADCWNKWLEDEPYFISVDHKGKGKFRVRVLQENPTPPEMAVFIGEWLYNLRAALDYAMYATAICDSGKAPPPKKDQIEFPCAYKEADWDKNLYRLEALSEYHRDEIVKLMQPYRHEDPDKSAIGWLHRLAKIDRHRRLTVMLGYTTEVNPRVGVPQGCKVRDRKAHRVVIDGEAEIASFTVYPWQDDWKVEVNPRAGIDPEIGDWAESPFWSGIRYNERLMMLRVAVETVVIPLEYDCTGYSRKAKVLTDSFRADLDARREKGESPAHIAPP
jgi:hypothetical protein